MIGFIGAGQVGITLGRYLASRGVKITGYYSRSYESAETGARLTGSNAYRQLQELVTRSSVLMITAPDDSIESIGYLLAECEGSLENKIVCHTSGAHPSSLLNILADRGATICSLHPMLSFASMDEALILLPTTPFTLEGRGKLKKSFVTLLEDSNLIVREIDTDKKALYHTAACVISNYLVTLMDIGGSCLNEAGFDQDAVGQLMKPLATATLQNYFHKGAEGALTGPISRGDIGTVTSHLHALTKENGQIEEIYRLLGLRTLDIATRQHRLDEYTLGRLKEVLQDEENNDGKYKKKEEK